MESLELFLTTVNKWLWGKWLVYVLLGLGILLNSARTLATQG